MALRVGDYKTKVTSPTNSYPGYLYEKCINSLGMRLTDCLLCYSVDRGSTQELVDGYHSVDKLPMHAAVQRDPGVD